MALVHCRSCGEGVDETATACPKCGAQQELPPGVAGFSFGAFWFNWLWGCFNGTWIALLALLPVVGFAMPFVLGVKGREWAWRNKRWDSVEHFQRVQRGWSIAAWCILGVGVAVIGGVMIADQHAGSKQVASSPAVDTPAAVAASPLQSAPPAPKAVQPAAAPTQSPDQVAAELLAGTPSRTPRAPAPASALPDAATRAAALMQRASTCSSPSPCIGAMLFGADQPDVVAAAADRLKGMDLPPAGDRKASRAQNADGLTAYRAGDYATAATLFARAAALNPRDAEAQGNLGLALLREGKTVEALDALNLALQNDPHRATAWMSMSEAMASNPTLSFAALLLAHQFSGNQQKTVDYLTTRRDDESATPETRRTFADALKVINGESTFTAITASYAAEAAPPSSASSAPSAAIASPSPAQQVVAAAPALLPAPAAPSVPQQSIQEQFVAAIGAVQRDARTVANDMQMGGLKARLDKQLCSILANSGGQVRNWSGTVSTVDANSDGKGVLAVEVAHNVTVKTWNNSLSDVSDHTLIEPDDALFAQASNLKVGQRVTFSGKFYKADPGCIEESSLTLKGKVTDPEFIFKFSAIAPS